MIGFGIQDVIWVHLFTILIGHLNHANIHLNIMTFSELINRDEPVLVDFYADWCAPCKAMKPILNDVKNQMGEQVSIYKIDVDKNQGLSDQFGIRSIPTLILFKNGEPVWRKSGMASSVELQQVISQHQ